MKNRFVFLLTFLAGLLCGYAVVILVPFNGAGFSQSGLLSDLLPRKPKVIGFLPFWLVNNARESYHESLSEISYFSLPLNPDGTIDRMQNAREQQPGWTALTRNENLQKHLDSARASGQSLSLVVFSGDRKTIYSLLSDPAVHAQNLINDVAPLMRQYGFSDLNVDIENVGVASRAAVLRFNEFLTAVKKGLQDNHLGTLTVDIMAMSFFEDHLTNPAELAGIADYLLLMTYDFHYAGSLISGPVAPLGGAGKTRVMDVNLVLRAALSVVPRHQIILGIPLYGYQWETLSDIPGSPVIPGTGVVASDGRVSRTLADCPGCLAGVDPVAGEPYVIIPERSHFSQIFYEDQAAVRAKVALALRHQIAGVAFWALGYEDSTDLDSLRDYKNVLF